MSERPGDTELYEEQFREEPEPEGDLEAYKRIREMADDRPLPLGNLLDSSTNPRQA